MPSLTSPVLYPCKNKKQQRKNIPLLRKITCTNAVQVFRHAELPCTFWTDIVLIMAVVWFIAPLCPCNCFSYKLMALL